MPGFNAIEAIWIGLDMMLPGKVEAIVGSSFSACFRSSAAGARVLRVPANCANIAPVYWVCAFQPRTTF